MSESLNTLSINLKSVRVQSSSSLPNNQNKDISGTAVFAEGDPNKASAVGEALHSVTLKVSGIAGLERYAKVLDYLRKLPEVSAVEVKLITPEQTVFNIMTKETKEDLKKSIANGTLLMEVNPAKAENSENPANPVLDQSSVHTSDLQADSKVDSQLDLISEGVSTPQAEGSEGAEGELSYKMSDSV